MAHVPAACSNPGLDQPIDVLLVFLASSALSQFEEQIKDLSTDSSCSGQCRLIVGIRELEKTVATVEDDHENFGEACLKGFSLSCPHLFDGVVLDEELLKPARLRQSG